MSDGDYNNEDVAQMSFQGFVNVAADGRDTSGTDDRGGNIDGAIADPISSVSRDNQWVSGASLVGVAVALLVLLLVVVIHRRKRRHDEFVRHLDDCSESSLGVGDGDGGSGDNPAKGGIASIVTIGEDDSLLMEDTLSIEHRDGSSDIDSFDGHSAGNAYADVHVCSSATCVTCQNNRMQQPIFLPASTKEDIQKDLGMVQERRSSPETTTTPDTVHL
eukprot:CAMPEP_0198121432 /NCGR_PEP_ID=MMETSP1442-20131203/32091_1 /TAXON_ID= /ORGANISM="Craspedostauros australis, Strain CCMP3328" /LENGTH=217 /DNA_ID=CAMNT_0043780237 /DNA_START=14 /DNA_END=667 /DNA_ORIENTATION=+